MELVPGQPLSTIIERERSEMDVSPFFFRGGDGEPMAFRFERDKLREMSPEELEKLRKDRVIRLHPGEGGRLLVSPREAELEKKLKDLEKRLKELEQQLGRKNSDRAFVFQSDSLLPWRTIIDNVAIGRVEQLGAALEDRQRRVVGGRKAWLGGPRRVRKGGRRPNGCYPAPFLKWAGGKGQLLEAIHATRAGSVIVMFGAPETSAKVRECESASRRDETS